MRNFKIIEMDLTTSILFKLIIKSKLRLTQPHGCLKVYSKKLEMKNKSLPFY